VRIGPLAERAAAEAMQAKLKAAGHVGATAVPPGR
jgi:cell division protein FtsN